MNQKERQITASAERIEEVCHKQRSLPELADNKTDKTQAHKKVHGIHIANIKISSLTSFPKGYNLLKKPTSPSVKTKKLQEISILAPHLETEDGKQNSIYKAAKDTHTCCWKTDLHLFNYMKVFSENHFGVRKIACWKLPRQAIAKGLSHFGSSFSARKNARGGHHKYMRILIGNLKEKASQVELENSLKEQLDLQKRQKDSRNYAQRPFLFS